MELNTHETMKYLNDVERQRFVAFQALFECEGWRLLIEYAQAKAAAALQRGAFAPTWEANRLAAGHREAWAEVANLEDQFMNEFEFIADERRGEASENSDQEFEVVEDAE